MKSLKSLVHCHKKIGRKDRNFPISKIGRMAAKIGRMACKKSDGWPAKNRTDVKKTDAPLFV
jgi:hypothetical protein